METENEHPPKNVQHTECCSTTSSIEVLEPFEGCSLENENPQCATPSVFTPALQGVYMYNDTFHSCDVAVKVQPEPEIFAPSISESITLFQCCSLKQVESFNHALNSINLNVHSSKSYSGVPELSQSSSLFPKTTDFFHCSYHRTVSTGQFLLRKEHLRLSNPLVSDLKALEVQSLNVGDKVNFQHRCEKLFRKYGSHVYVGDIHFGGVFSWGAQYSGQTKDIDSLKQQLEEIVPKDIDISFPITLPQDVSLYKTVKGGQRDVTSFNQWKKSLEVTNRLGTLIDRGNQTVGIWEVLLNHTDDFRNATQLGHMVQAAWEENQADHSPEEGHSDNETGDFGFVHLPSSKEVESVADEGYSTSIGKREKEVYEPETANSNSTSTMPRLSGESDVKTASQKVHDKDGDQTSTINVDVTEVLSTDGQQERIDPPDQDKIQDECNVKGELHSPEESFDILEHLGLNKYYPEKITLQEVMQICETLDDDNVNVHDVPWRILQKLIMLDRKAVISEIGRCAKLNKDPTQESEDTVQDDDSSLDSLTDLSDLSEDKSKINPADVFLAIFLCCDLNLRQILVEKMNQCRLAIPFIFPDRYGESLTLTIWALRSTILTWRSALQAVQTSAVNTPTHVISCLRLKRPQLSKSKLLNKLINEQVDDTFLNVDSPNGDSDKAFANGLVETSFFLPSGQSSKCMDGVSMFLNLRGDGTQHEKQVEILSKVSSAILVCLDITDLSDADVQAQLKNLHDQCKNIVLILSGGKCLSKGKIKKYLQDYKDTFGGKAKRVFSFNSKGEMNASHLRDEILEVLKQCPLGKQKILMQDQYLMNCGISIDEQNEHCQEGKRLADQVMSHIVSNKTELLPLQDETWMQWCKLLKSKKRSQPALDDRVSMQDVGRVEMKMQEYRGKQGKICDNLGPFIRSFIDGLLTAPSSTALDFYIKWLDIKLNDLSRESLPPLQRHYHELLHNLQTAKDAGNVDNKSLERDIKVTETQIANTAIGIEHLMREMGQIYEATIETNDGKKCKNFEHLPCLAAKLLLQGHAFEIMDGDASGVPLTWISAVFKELEKTLENKKLFCLSVLGIQSSGKSTLLNTMFGLRFPVSAGRCTRGVYMQLMKVKHDSKLPFHYVAVLDSEGLRAPDLGESKYNHDNELATFVVGLGNATMINVKGENVAEIKDVLQIVSHAFLRMKMVSASIQKDKSCLFVHQNVPAVDAREKMMSEARKFQETLDEKTSEAAALEDIADIHSFNQVIRFDSRKDIWYFPDLWYGDPPMASVNSGYHQSIMSLRSSLLKDQLGNNQLCLTVSEFSKCISDLWNGVLADDFVFAFRNSIVTKAYNQLEKFYSKLKYELEVAQVEWCKRIHWLECETKEDLHSYCVKLKADAGTMIHETKDTLLSKLSTFIENHSQKEIMITWQKDKEYSLQYTAESLCKKAMLDIDKEGAMHGVRLLKNKSQNLHKKEILGKAQKLAEQVRTKDEDTIRGEFNSMWNEWIRNLSTEHTRLGTIQENISDLLYEHLPRHHNLLYDELTKHPLDKFPILEDSIKEEDITQEDIRPRNQHLFSKVWKGNEQSQQLDAISEINVILRNVDSYLRTLSGKFNFEHVEEALSIVAKGIESFHKQSKLFMSKHFEIRLRVHIAKYFLRSDSMSTKIKDLINEHLSQIMPDHAVILDHELLREFHLCSLKGSIRAADLKDTDLSVGKHGKIKKVKSKALKYIDDILVRVDAHLKTLSEQNSGFQSHDAKELLLIMQNGIENIHEEDRREEFKIPANFAVRLHVHVLRYAMNVFYEMQDFYDRTCSISAQLEDYKKTTWNYFIHKVHETQVEIVTVDMLCEELDSVIKKNVEKNLGIAVFKEIVPHFYTKEKLIKAVLQDLAEKELFSFYALYLHEPKAFVTAWLCKYIEVFIFGGTESCWYMRQAKMFVDNLITTIEESIDHACAVSYEHMTLGTWRACFSRKLLETSRSISLMTSYPPEMEQHEVEDFQYIKAHFVKRMKTIKDKVLGRFNKRIENTVPLGLVPMHMEIVESIWGCNQLCPFCKEPCTKSNPNHASTTDCHECLQHRPHGVVGWVSKSSEELMIYNCNILVATESKFRCSNTVHECDKKDESDEVYHPHKDYKKYLPEWTIHSSTDMDSSEYWKWFMGRFAKELADAAMAKEPSIPESWKNISKGKAIESLFIYD